jgi:hypothetical protein
VSRFLNENYLGYLLAIFALAILSDSAPLDEPLPSAA